MGDTGDAADVVDEQLWGDDKDMPEESGKAEEKYEKDAPIQVAPAALHGHTQCGLNSAHVHQYNHCAHQCCSCTIGVSEGSLKTSARSYPTSRCLLRLIYSHVLALPAVCKCVT